MTTGYLLDTHILTWFLTAPQKLSAEQRRIMRKAAGRGEPLAYSAITLLEIAVVFGIGNRKAPAIAAQILQDVEDDPNFLILPITFQIATEVASMSPHLQDPNDRAIVATARIHQLTLLTADERIIKSKLVPTIP